LSTTHRVKMAKASQKDIDGAIELYQFLQAMNSGRSCPEVVDEFGYNGYEDLLEREATDVEFALRAHERGGLFRVVWGMQVLLDPCNEVVDPNLPHLELHPKHEQAAKDRDATRAELAAVKRQRDELVAIAAGLRERVRGVRILYDHNKPTDPLRVAIDCYEGVAKLIEALAAEQPKPQQPEVQS